MLSRSLRRGLVVITIFWVRPRGGLGAALETGHGKIGGDAWGSGRCLGIAVTHDDILRVPINKTVGHSYLDIVARRSTTMNGDGT